MLQQRYLTFIYAVFMHYNSSWKILTYFSTQTPANYENKDFYSRALQHSKVELTWDEDEPARANTLKRKFNDEQVSILY